jgi:hypothetical protein
MDWFYFFIIFIALTIFFLDRVHFLRKKENFTMKPNKDFPPKEWGVNYQAPQPKQYEDKSKINVLPNPWNKGFGRFGATPPRPRCNVTVMGENCTNYPYDTSTDNYQSVCQKTYNIYPTDANASVLGSLNREVGLHPTKPWNVMGKAIGRVRQCRTLYN